MTSKIFCHVIASSTVSSNQHSSQFIVLPFEATEQDVPSYLETFLATERNDSENISLFSFISYEGHGPWAFPKAVYRLVIPRGL